MTAEPIVLEMSGYLAEQVDAFDDMIRQRDSARRIAVALEQECDEQARRISLACLLVDGILDHAPEECDCEQDGRVCVWHRMDDALRGVTRDDVQTRDLRTPGVVYGPENVA